MEYGLHKHSIWLTLKINNAQDYVYIECTVNTVYTIKTRCSNRRRMSMHFATSIVNSYLDLFLYSYNGLEEL